MKQVTREVISKCGHEISQELSGLLSQRCGEKVSKSEDQDLLVYFISQGIACEWLATAMSFDMLKEAKSFDELFSPIYNLIKEDAEKMAKQRRAVFEEVTSR